MLASSPRPWPRWGHPPFSPLNQLSMTLLSISWSLMWCMLLCEVELMLSQPLVALSSLVATAGCHQSDQQLLQFPNVRTPFMISILFICVLL
jgi:hypothetical protein